MGRPKAQSLKSGNMSLMHLRMRNLPVSLRNVTASSLIRADLHPCSGRFNALCFSGFFTAAACVPPRQGLKKETMLT